MKYLLFLFLLFIGCNKASVNHSYPAPQGNLLFSVEILSSALGSEITGKTGYYFYLDGYPMVIIYQYHQGEIIGRSGLSSSKTKELLNELDQVSFEAFNLDEEIENVRETWAENGQPIRVSVAMDGAEYKIRYVQNDINYDLTMWNPKYPIELYAPYSPKIQKLKEIIDIFATAYGHSKFGI